MGPGSGPPGAALGPAWVGRWWSGRLDSNQRPLRPERSALPSCATPRRIRSADTDHRKFPTPYKPPPYTPGPGLGGTLPTASPIEFAAAAAVVLAVGFTLAAMRPSWVAGRPVWVLTVLFAITGLAGFALLAGPPVGLNLRIDPSTEPLLPTGDPAREVYQEAVADFGEDEVYVIAMETEGGVFHADMLRRLGDVTNRIARFPEVRQVSSLMDVVAFRYDHENDWLEVADFIEEVPESAEALAQLERDAVRDPMYRRTLISDDGRTAAINVTFRRMTDQVFIESRIDARVMEVLDEYRTEGVQFHVAGRSHVKTRVYHLMLRDMRVLIPAALGVVALGLWLVFGTRRGVVLPMGIIVLATIWTFGGIAYLDRPLTVLTTLLAPMLSAIGSVYGIHALARYEEEALEAETPRQAAERTLRHLRLPVGVAGATTMIGFGALLITDVPAVFEVGAFSVLGVAAITLLSVTGLPAALALMPLRPHPAGDADRLSGRIALAVDRVLERVADLASRRSGTVIVVWASLLVLCGFAIPRIVIDTDYLSFFPEDAPVRQEFEAVNRLLAGAVPIYVSFRGDGAGAFREPEAVHMLDRVQKRAEEIPAVSRSLSLVDTVRLMNRKLAKDDPAEERIPDTRGGVAEILFMAPKGHLDAFTNVNHGKANILARTGALGTQAVRGVASDLEAVVAGADVPEGITAAVTGNAILLARSADGIARSQPRTVGLAGLAILILVSVAFRSFRLGGVAMVPNFVPVVMYFGILGLGAASLSLPTSLIGSVALGIAIDDTAHFLVRYGTERRAGLSPEQAARVTGLRVGRPIAITTVMLMAGFLVVALSGFATLQQFGILSAVTMGICLLTDLVMLPALLIRTRA